MQVVDFDALEAAGVGNARGRAGLIEYLDGLGFTTEEMVDAESRGRLFALCGDALQCSGRPTYSLRTAADALGVAVDDVAHAWAALVLTVAGLDHLALSQADVDALATWVGVRQEVGDDAAFGLLRVLGASMARLAEAESTMIRAGKRDIRITHTRDELATAQAYRAAAEFIPGIGAMIDAVHRNQLGGARA